MTTYLALSGVCAHWRGTQQRRPLLRLGKDPDRHRKHWSGKFRRVGGFHEGFDGLEVRAGMAMRRGHEGSVRILPLASLVFLRELECRQALLSALQVVTLTPPGKRKYWYYHYQIVIIVMWISFELELSMLNEVAWARYRKFSRNNVWPSRNIGSIYITSVIIENASVTFISDFLDQSNLGRVCFVVC